MPTKTTATGRRRLLSDTDTSSLLPKAPICSAVSVNANASIITDSTVAETEKGACAEFITTNEQGRREVISLTLDRPVTIGRNRRDCSYVIENKIISNLHCKLAGVLSSTGGVLVSCQDSSTNGILLNGYKLRRSAALVMDGDVIELPNGRVFTCYHITKEPKDMLQIFEPTPPQGSATYKNLVVGKYIVVSHCLGSGSFAFVHVAFDTLSCKQVACKTVIAKSRDDAAMKKVMKEVEILGNLNHPNINRVLDVKVNNANGWLHIFLELCTGGDLFTYITHRHHLSEPEGKFIMYQIMRGIEYLHGLNISHRDLKPENILLYAPGPFPRIQIADFGLARPNAYQETKNVCGTISYMPPEGIVALDNNELGYVGMPADCWSTGLILFMVLTGNHPFDYRDDPRAQEDQNRLAEFSQGEVVSEEVMKSRIVRCPVWYSEFWHYMPQGKELIEGLLEREPSHRMTIEEALASPWIQDEIEALEGDYIERTGQPSFV